MCDCAQRLRWTDARTIINIPCGVGCEVHGAPQQSNASESRRWTEPVAVSVETRAPQKLHGHGESALSDQHVVRVECADDRHADAAIGERGGEGLEQADDIDIDRTANAKHAEAAIASSTFRECGRNARFRAQHGEFLIAS